MTRARAPRRGERPETLFLRAIGSLALARYELETLLESEEVPAAENWSEQARQLLRTSAAIMAASVGNTAAGAAITIDRGGVRTSLEADDVDVVTGRIRRLVQAGLASP